MKAMSGIKMKNLLNKMFEGYGKSISKVNLVSPEIIWDASFICTFKSADIFCEWFKGVFGDKYIREDFLEAIWEHSSEFSNLFKSEFPIGSETQFSLVLLVEFFRNELKRLSLVDSKLSECKEFKNA